MRTIIGMSRRQPEQLDLLAGYIKGCFVGGEYLLIRSADPADFLAQLSSAPAHLVFLDVDMPGMNGIRLGEEIRALYRDAAIIYITAHEEYALQAFDVRAFHYLLKPLTREKFRSVFQEALDRIGDGETTTPEKMFSVQLRGENAPPALRRHSVF